jgi:hypothetical protein
MPCRRATSETTAAGAILSSRIRAFSSANQRRRPLVPVITCSRPPAAAAQAYGQPPTQNDPEFQIASLAAQTCEHKVGLQHRLRSTSNAVREPELPQFRSPEPLFQSDALASSCTAQVERMLNRQRK